MTSFTLSKLKMVVNRCFVIYFAAKFLRPFGLTLFPVLII